MLRLLVPLTLAALGTGGGVAAAMFLMPGADHAAADAEHAPAEAEHAALEGVPPCGPVEPEAATSHAAADGHGATGGSEYFKINNQFVVPRVTAGRVESLIVASISLEIGAGTQSQVFAVEPRLRDAILQVLFDHSNLGGFDGVFTSAANMRALRTALLVEARRVLGPTVQDVLITDLVRQDTAS